MEKSKVNNSPTRPEREREEEKNENSDDFVYSSINSLHVGKTSENVLILQQHKQKYETLSTRRGERALGEKDSR